MSGKHEIHRTSEAIQIGPMIDFVTVQCLFGGQIISRSQDFVIEVDGQTGFRFV